MLFVIIAILCVVISIILGARLGGIGIAYAAGIGLFILTMVMGVDPGSLPINVVLIIMAVIGSIAVLELCGGLDYMVHLSTIILKSNPKYINFLAPAVTFILTVLAGTGHTSYSVMPVIIQVAKEQGIRPVRPLTTAVIGSQVGIVSSPIAAAMVAIVGILEPLHVNLISVVGVTFTSCFLGLMCVAFLQGLLPQKLETDKKYQELLQKTKTDNTLVKEQSIKKEIPKMAPYAVLMFLCAILIIVFYGLFPQFKPVYQNGKSINTAFLIVIVMLLNAYLMTLLTKVDIKKIANQATFKAGMTAALCVIGVAWLGDTLVSYYKIPIQELAGDFLTTNSWAFAIIVFFIGALLYSPAATTLAILPLGMTLGLSPLTLITSFIAVSSIFVLPTYPTLIAAVQMDDTGTTKMGKYIFDHSFIIPGILTIIFSILFAYIIGSFVL